MIISSDDLVRRNGAFAATGAFADLPFPTSETPASKAAAGTRYQLTASLPRLTWQLLAAEAETPAGPDPATET
jgi:hypothetical protein